MGKKKHDFPFSPHPQLLAKSQLLLSLRRRLPGLQFVLITSADLKLGSPGCR